MERKISAWKLHCSRAPSGHEEIVGKVFDATVPGDVTDVLMRAQVIGDIQYSDNYVKYRWVIRSEWVYTAVLEISEEEYAQDILQLRFEGIDTFSDIYINGEKALTTCNMFLAYTLDLKGKVRVGENTVQAVVRPTDENAVSYGEKYGAAFRAARLGVRKAQCHFGWDWAPDYYGMGIWLPVTLVAKSRRSIEYVRVRTRVSGTVTFFPQLNFSVREKSGAQWAEDVLVIRVSDGEKCVCMQEFPTDGYKNLCNLTVPSPELWYPNGYGKPFLYRYEVLLKDRQGNVRDTYSGTFGIREIRILQDPVGKDRLNFQIEVNGRRVFVKGSNWVPAGFMTGAIDDARYERLLTLARDGGYNTLRVWGGGIYEKDLFYELCDSLGILVWQDFMFACGDVTDDLDDFCRLVTEEAVYQVKRLCDHPSLLLFNGGNEIKQSFAYSRTPKLGTYLTDYILQGICGEFSDVPYFRSCPFSYTDWGNDLGSGDCHKCAFIESAKEGHPERYRQYIVKEKPLTTECAMMGPCRMRNLRKFIPKNKLWPINEIWDIHFVENPYEEKLPRSFARLEVLIAEALFGEVVGVEDFVKKAMIAHADFLQAELEFARADAGICGGIMTWMYNDIWRNGTWSAVDYDLACKPAYYAMKRAFMPVLAGIVLRDGYRVFVSDQSGNSASGILNFGQRTVRGETLFETSCPVCVPQDGVTEIPISHPISDRPDSYLFVEFNGSKNIYFINGYRGTEFESRLACSVSPIVKEGERYCCRLHVRAKAFAKSVFADAEEKFDLRVQDNYFDLEEGDEKEIFLSCGQEFCAEDISVKTFADVWNE